MQEADLDEPDPHPDSFDGRLRDARARHGLNHSASHGPETMPSPNLWGIGMRVGIELVSALVVATAIGYGLDRWLHTIPLFLVVFMLLGSGAGILNVWRLMAPRRSAPD